MSSVGTDLAAAWFFGSTYAVAAATGPPAILSSVPIVAGPSLAVAAPIIIAPLLLFAAYDILLAKPMIKVIMVGQGIEGNTIWAMTNTKNTNGTTTITYQWWLDGVPIPGAVNKYYTLTQAEVGKYLFVVAMLKDVDNRIPWNTNYYKAESLRGLVENANSPVSGVVTISGTPIQNQVLSASNTLRDEDGMGPVTYTWIRDPAPQNTLPTGAVGITGRLARTNVLTAINTLADIDGLGPITYTWYRSGEQIATGPTYKLISADVDHRLTVTANYVDGLGVAQSVTSGQTDVVTHRVTLRNTNTPYNAYIAENAITDAASAVTYYWTKNKSSTIVGRGHLFPRFPSPDTFSVTAEYTNTEGVLIKETSRSTGFTPVTSSYTPPPAPTDPLAVELDTIGGERIATGPTYTLTQADVGYYIRAIASYTDPFNHVTNVVSLKTASVANANDPVVGEVIIDGTPEQYQILTANASGLSDVDGLGAFTYQWKRNGSNISGATGYNYTLANVDVGCYISVTASFIDGDGGAESKTSAQTNAVVHVNTLPSGTVTVSGTPRQNEILTISNTLADVDGMGPISYQWNLNDSPKWGFTGTTYALTQAEVGKTISVTASYTNNFGIRESYTSPATAAVANVNDQLTGAAYIIGNAVQNQVLTAITHGLNVNLPGLSDLDGLGEFSYQWKRSNGNTFDNIQDATAMTYVLTSEDVGHGLKVTVSYTDGGGTVESYTSSVTAIVVNVNDSPTGDVTIAGSPEEDQVLTVTNTLDDRDGMGPVSYQWNRDEYPILGATGSTYTLTQGDVGRTITVTATYYDGQGTYEIITSNKISPVVNVNDLLTGDVFINGIAEQYKVLFADTSRLSDEDGMGTLVYQWNRNGVPILGATGSSYWLNEDDVGKEITVAVYSTDLLGGIATKTSDTVNPTNINDLPTGQVTITGIPKEHQTLTVTNNLADLDGMVGGSASPITYQWQRYTVDIAGATGTTYTLTQADVGTAIRVVASYMDSHGTHESKISAYTSEIINSIDLPVGSVTITGTAAYPQLLTATNDITDLDGVYNLYYEWKRNGAHISGATGTGSTYKLTLADVDKQMTAIAHYFDGTGVEKIVTSTPTATVLFVNTPSSGAVTIGGSPVENQGLTANISAISDLDGINSFSYQWKRNGIPISGATNRFYPLSSTDVGSTISVTVKVTDELNADTTITSAATTTILSSPNQYFNGVFISGTLLQGSTLTASNTLYDADGIEWVKYKWQRSSGFVYAGTSTYSGSNTDFDDIVGATTDTYTLVQADVGRKIRLCAIVLYMGWDPANTVQVFSEVSVPVANIDDLLTGEVSITGTPVQKQWLDLSTTLYDPDGSSIIYQWKRNGVDIPGAVGYSYVANVSSYRLVQDDVGKQITVTARSTDSYGNIELRTTAPTAVIANANDLPTGSVTIEGILQHNKVLTATIRNISDLDGIASAFSYQWSRNFEDIPGATNSTYTTSIADISMPIMVTVKYTDLTGANESIISEPVFITRVNTLPVGTVFITGTPARFQLLTASNTLTDADGKGAVSYKWKRNGTQIATGSTYQLTLADVGKQITVTASYTDSLGTVESVTSDPTTTITYVNSPVTGDVTISGTPAQNQILTANTSALSDLDGLGAFSYQWIRGTETILGATNSTYTLVQADVGKVISVKVSYIDLQGATESKTSAATATVVDVNDLPIGVVTIAGTAIQGATLTASNTLTDADGMGTVTYRWYFNGLSKFEAVGPTYTLIKEDVGKTVTVTASYTDLTGVPSSVTSAATVAVVNVNDPLVGRVSINGTAQQGQRLTVNTSAISDLDGRGTYSYIWMRNGVNILGATGSGYTLTQADVGKQITITASYTDLRGTYESSTSLPTVPVANVNDSPAGIVFIDGTLQQNELLTATLIGLSDADGLGQPSYQWMRNGSNIDLATNSTYRLVQADVGKQITVSMSYTDGFGKLETILSNAATSTVLNVNDSPTGTVTISGFAAQYETLTASHSIIDPDGVGMVSYRWKRNGAVIAVGTSYTLTAADVGSTMTVTAVYTDLLGNYENIGITSAPTAVVVRTNTSVTGEIIISRTSPVTGEVTTSGTPKENELLTAITDGLSDVDGLAPTFSYQWKSDGIDILDATNSTYTLTQAMIGKTISVTVSYTDVLGSAESKTSAPTAPVINMNDLSVGEVIITGLARVTNLLTASPSLYDADGLGTFSYQWMRSGYTIPLATGSTYTLTPDDESHYITVAVSYTDLQGTDESVISIAVGPVVTADNEATGGVTIIGTPAQNQVLTASNTLVDIDGIYSIDYVWINNDQVELGRGTSYTLAPYDVGTRIKVVAVCRDMQGHTVYRASDQTDIIVEVNDSPTGTVIIIGTPTQNENLYVDFSTLSDLDGLYDDTIFTYQWMSNGINISDATDSIYTLLEADVGKQISVTVKYTDGYGTEETLTSDPTAPVANVNDLPTGSVTITGTPAQYEVLTASNTLADIDGLGPITYQWNRDGSAISGATGDTYTLTQAEVGKYITVVASYTDGHGTVESATSDATAIVVNANDLPSGLPIITGITTEGQVLTADTSGISDLDGLGTFTYQWKRKSQGAGQGYASISGATNATYTLTQDDVSKHIIVVVQYTDGYGTPEIRASTDTALIANVNDLPTGSVTIAGIARKYEVLTVSHTLGDLDGLGEFLYQWLRDGSNISLATASTYTLVTADVGRKISAKVSYTDGFGVNESVTSTETAPVENVNKLPIGTVTITGTPTQNQVLTAITSGLSDLDGLGAFSYQWLRDGSNISLATASTYTLVHADVGKAISVKVSYTDLQGTDESVTSAATAPIANANDSPVGLPTITGITTQGQVLTVDASGVSDLDGLGAFSYQWMRDGFIIPLATGSTYLLVQSDVGQAISVKVSYTDLQGTPESVTSAATVPIANVNDSPTGSVTISGTPTQNQVLTVSNTLADIDGLGPITYQWMRSGDAISGATSTTYRLTEADVGYAIRVTVSYTDAFNKLEKYDSDSTVLVANVNDPVTGEVIISGTPTQNQVLTVSHTLADADGLGPITYQWLRDGSNISLATASTYTLLQADVGRAISVKVSYKDLHGTDESITSAATTPIANVNDSPVGLPIITGIKTQGQVLTVDTSGISDLDVVGAFTYQWRRDGSNISLATASTYTLIQADVGKKISVKVSYTDGFGADESVTSAETAPVANVNDSPTGSVTITGTPIQNQVLTASNTLADIDDLGPITYQWKSNGVAISGATGASYKLTQAEVGKSITVTASYADLMGTLESVTSAATAQVANVNDPIVGHVMIDGDLTHGQTLTASHTLTDVDGLGAVSYQWLKNGAMISGAVDSTYILTPGDIGAKISVTASYTDGHGTPEQKSSVETYPIQPIRPGYSLSTKGIASMSLSAPVNSKITITKLSELAITTSDNMAAFSTMTTVEKQSFVKNNVSALISKYKPSSSSDKLYVSKDLLPFATTSPLVDKVELVDAKSSSVASPLVQTRDASMGAVYIDTAPGNSVTLTYSPDTVTITQTSETAFSVVINGAAAVNKSIGDKILLKTVVLTLGSITAVPNSLPVFVQNAPTTVFEDASYSYTVSVSDADNDTFTVTAPILPSWLTFTQATGTLSCLSVPSSVVGSHPVQFLAEDIWGGKTYYDFTITVQNVPATGTVTSSGSLKYSDLNAVQTPVLKAIYVSESDAAVVINTATVNGVNVVPYLQLGAGPSNYTVTVKSGQHAALLTLLRTNPGNISIAIKVTDISTPASPIYIIETIAVLNDSPTTTQQFPSSMTIIEDSSTAYAQSGGTDSVITFSEACSVVLNGTYKDYFMLAATDGTNRTYKLKCKDLASARAILPGTSYNLTVTATSIATALTVTSTSLSVRATNILTTAIVGGAQILTHASLQAYITSSAAIPNIATITLSESDPQSVTLQTVTVNGSSVDKTYFTMVGSAGSYVLSVNTSAVSQLLTRLSAIISSSSAYSMLMTFQVVEQGENAFTQTITVAASNNIIKLSLKSTVTNVPIMVSYSATGSVATVVMNYSATPVIDYADYIISDANSAVGTRVVGGGIAYDGAILPTMYTGVSLVRSIVYQSPGEWIVTYYESYSGVTGSQSNTLTLKFSVRGAINFVLPTLNASLELSAALSIVGNYTAPAPFALPTITLSMPASQFNDGLFQLALTDSNINTLVNPAAEAVYYSEKITYYTNQAKFPELKNSGNVLLKDLPVVNGAALKPLRQRNAGADRLSDSMVHELAYQAIGVSLMNDQLANGAALTSSIDNYLTTALPQFVKLQLANCDGKTQNINGATDLTTRENVSRELFMQIVESVVGDVNASTVSAKSSRLNSLFADSNLTGGRYGIKFIAGDTLRFSITISPYSVGGVVQDVDYIVDGVLHPKQEARTVELVITMV